MSTERPASATTGDEPLEFTGERFTPECVREIWYEHWHRYAFARAFAQGRRVLDAACGEGYGSALLAGSARSVTGVDIAAGAIAHARRRYSRPNLHFEQGDCTALRSEAGAFDLVVSFETLEHVAAQEALIAGFARVLAPDGLLLISSPDKRSYSDKTGVCNEFHVRELYRDELLALLRAHFPHVRMYAQKLLFQSAIWALDEAAGGVQATTYAEPDVLDGLHYEPLYYIAVCARRPLDPAALPQIALFGDVGESVYTHYNGEVRKNIQAGRRIAELEAALQAATRARGAPAAGTGGGESAGARQSHSFWRRWWARGPR